MGKKLIISFVVIIILVSLSFSGCNINRTKTPVKVPTKHVQKKPENSKTGTSIKPFSLLKYDIVSIPFNTKIELNTPWETSPLGKLEATVEGKGEKAEEEGYSHIIIKDKKSGTLIKLTLENETKNQLTAKALAWIDENHMFVILGEPFGTVSMGGEIYELNIINGDTSLYLDTTSLKEEFTSIHKTSDGFKYEKFIYDDSNFIKGHIETGIFKLK